jgi:LemA protein
MSKTTSTIILIIIILVTLPLFFITIPIVIWMYNSLVKKRNQVEYAYGGVDVALQKRGELIPNLVETVKKYMAHEEKILTEIVKLRSQIEDSDSQSTQRFEMENQMSGMLKNLMISVENYPDLKSNENVLHLQRTLNEVEEQISASRRAYNAAVNGMNNGVQTFPSSLVSSAGGFELAAYFEADEAIKKAPDMKKLFNT